MMQMLDGFGWGGYSPAINFMLMPIYFDALKLQAIEFNDSIRKSAYHFELNSGKYLKLFPNDKTYIFMGAREGNEGDDL